MSPVEKKQILDQIEQVVREKHGPSRDLFGHKCQWHSDISALQQTLEERNKDIDKTFTKVEKQLDKMSNSQYKRDIQNRLVDELKEIHQQTHPDLNNQLKS